MARGLAQGRFEKDADPLFREINDSLAFDVRLATQDIAGSAAWARAIHRAGVIDAGELARLESALGDLAGIIARDPSAPGGTGHEDIHSWVEAELVARVGALGKKLHTGRSRNDQVATDLRLWCRGAIDVRLGEVRVAQRSLVSLARRELATAMPGYTHLQRGQPVLLSHWALAYVEMLERDAERLADARRRVNRCPLGSGALAGTAYAIDREALAKDLGFDAPTANSLDAVGDRDFVLETLAAAGTTAVHLSRFAEELVLWCSSEFAFVALDDSVTSGSSLMPQKKNPDALELVRGKCGRVLGSWVSLATTLKGLPLAYNKDMQEDKEPLFDAMGSLSLCLRIVPRVCEGLRVDRARCREAALGGYSNATELADYLVSKGVPFRDAHDATGRIVRRAIELGRRLEEMPIDELRAVAPAIGEDVGGWLTLDSVLSRREVLGGTAPRAVASSLAAWERRLGMV
ncbi:MAG: argininosuccinate lyase [Phycisphaerae bacterium]|nr:argininosuccinate lyase [Phycisphaerae bacterium]